MSPRYNKEIALCAQWIRANVRSFPKLTHEQRRNGIDALPKHLFELLMVYFDRRLGEGYELSYNQMCQAYFGVADGMPDNQK